MSDIIELTQTEIIQSYELYVDMLYRICFMLLKNETDAEDAVQAVFIKMIEQNRCFESREHQKAWLIVVAQNHCKNQLKHWWKKTIEFDVSQHGGSYNQENSELLELVLKLPEKYKLPIYFYYYEGYSTDEIAKILELNASTLRSRLKKGRALLKLKLGGDTDE